MALLGGALLGLIGGALAGYGLGMALIEFTPPSNRGREMGIAVVLVFMPFGGILGAIIGAILLGRRAARRGPTWVDKILLIASGIVAALAVLGLVMLPPLIRVLTA